jgi:putative GTP pyrophosphokinase
MSTVVGAYTERYNVVLTRIDTQLRGFLEEVFGSSDYVCKISTRPKKIASFMTKAAQARANGQPKYNDPLAEIQDQLGALIITRFLSDIPHVETVIDKTFRRIERQHLVPDSEYEFGYEGRHFILFLPTDISTHYQEDTYPEFFELQIKTLFQYAWSETYHAIGYKQNDKLTAEQRRLTAFVAAQAWGADRAVDELKRDFEAEREPDNA